MRQITGRGTRGGALPMRGRMIHPIAGELDFQPYSHSGDRAINSISRGALNNALLDAALSHPNVSVQFEQKITSLAHLDADIIIGADGAGSAVRGQLHLWPIARDSPSAGSQLCAISNSGRR